MTIWVILAITPFVVLLFLEEVIQFFYQRYVYGAGKVEKQLTNYFISGWKRVQQLIQKSRVKAEG